MNHQFPINHLVNKRVDLKLWYVTGEGENLGGFALHNKAPIRSELYICKTCGRTIGYVIVKMKGYEVDFFIREIRCADCAGDDTLFFHGYMQSQLDDPKTLPLPLLTYELNAAAKGNLKWTYQPRPPIRPITPRPSQE